MTSADVAAGAAQTEMVQTKATEIVAAVRLNKLICCGASVVSLGVGAFFGYQYAKKKIVAHYEAVLDREIQHAKEFYGRLNKKGQFATPESAAQALLVTEAAEALVSYQGVSGRLQAQVVDSEELVETNVFVQSKVVEDDFDYEEEGKDRSPEKPYVISLAEFMQNEPEFTQATVTYYEGDDTLVDENDVAIEDHEATVGNDNLEKFGHGSKDNNIVCVRNERTQMDFEIVRHTGTYTEQVLGFIEHSDKPGLRRFRLGDDE